MFFLQNASKDTNTKSTMDYWGVWMLKAVENIYRLTNGLCWCLDQCYNIYLAYRCQRGVACLFLLSCIGWKIHTQESHWHITYHDSDCPFS
jgi:hypothetical protein